LLTVVMTAWALTSTRPVSLSLLWSNIKSRLTCILKVIHLWRCKASDISHSPIENGKCMVVHEHWKSCNFNYLFVVINIDVRLMEIFLYAAKHVTLVGTIIATVDWLIDWLID
jgi:hypothetical protein